MLSRTGADLRGNWPNRPRSPGPTGLGDRPGEDGQLLRSVQTGSASAAGETQLPLPGEGLAHRLAQVADGDPGRVGRTGVPRTEPGPFRVGDPQRQRPGAHVLLD